MPYRIDLRDAGDAALDRLVELGALDVESSSGGILSALLPDSVALDDVRRMLGVDDVTATTAVGRDAGSVWILSPRPVRIGSLRIVPAHGAAEPGALRLIDAPAFGTGLHPTTALCLTAVEEAVRHGPPAALLDVGTGSGILALGALTLGVPRATAVDVDGEALRVAAENARLNGLDERLELIHGTPDAVTGRWPLVVANILAAPLIEMAPALTRRVGHHGQLILSGIRTSLEPDVARAYRHAGMRCVDVQSRENWVALVLLATW